MKKKLTDLFIKNKKRIIILVGVIALVVVAVFSYSKYSSNKVQQQSLEFKNILDMLVVGNKDDLPTVNEKLQNLQSQNNKGFKTLAYLTEFKNYVEQDDLESAKEVLNKTIDDKKVPAIYQDMSKYYLIVILLKEGNIDLADEKADELITNPKSNYYTPALLVSVGTNIQKNNYDKALRNAELIINNKTANPQMVQIASSLKYYIIEKQSVKK